MNVSSPPPSVQEAAFLELQKPRDPSTDGKENRTTTPCQNPPPQPSSFDRHSIKQIRTTTSSISKLRLPAATLPPPVRAPYHGEPPKIDDETKLHGPPQIGIEDELRLLKNLSKENVDEIQVVEPINQVNSIVASALDLPVTEEHDHDESRELVIEATDTASCLHAWSEVDVPSPSTGGQVWEALYLYNLFNDEYDEFGDVETVELAPALAKPFPKDATLRNKAVAEKNDNPRAMLCGFDAVAAWTMDQVHWQIDEQAPISDQSPLVESSSDFEGGSAGVAASASAPDEDAPDSSFGKAHSKDICSNLDPFNEEFSSKYDWCGNVLGSFPSEVNPVISHTGRTLPPYSSPFESPYETDELASNASANVDDSISISSDEESIFNIVELGSNATIDDILPISSDGEGDDESIGTTSHAYVEMRVAKYFGDFLYGGSVVKYYPRGRDGKPLWGIVYDDDDYEDMDESEVIEAIELYEES